MDQPYSVWADGLSKFHAAPVWIQALWIIAGTACTLSALHTVRTIIVAALRRGRDPGIELVYGICRDHTGRLMIYPELKQEKPSPVPSLPEWRDRLS
ncbi:hypothetical protein DC522_32405 [Microvirga sp. KLBC 81]|nr:hypothetical protein DC522_32405 [Microvirga sp. KLBC 81]